MLESTLKLTAIKASPSALKKFKNKTLQLIVGNEVVTLTLKDQQSLKAIKQQLFSSFADIGSVVDITINIQDEEGTVIHSETQRVEVPEGSQGSMDLTFDGETISLEMEKEITRPKAVSYGGIKNLETSVRSITELLHINSTTTNYDLFGEVPPGSTMINKKITRITLVEIDNRSPPISGTLGFQFELAAAGGMFIGVKQHTTFEWKWPDGERKKHFCIKVYKEDPEETAELNQEGFVDAINRVAIAVNVASTSQVQYAKGHYEGFLNTQEEGIQKISVRLSDTGGGINPVELDLSFSVEILNGCIFPGHTGKPVVLNRPGGLLLGGTVFKKPTGNKPEEEEFFPDQPCDIEEPPYVLPCYAYMAGPACICKCETHDYTVLSNCEGYCDNWEIDDDGENIAIIVSINGCVATVQNLKEGEFLIKCTYFFLNGGSIQLVRKVAAYEMNHVIGGSTDSVIKTTPLIQPHPFVQITTPYETPEHSYLQKNVDFIVHERKLSSDLSVYDPEEVAARYYEVELKVKGTITDFFQETLQCRWEVVGQGGRLFEKAELVKRQEFDDTTFETKMPGEDNMNPRVILLKGIGKHEVKIIPTNAIQEEGTDWITVTIELNAHKLDEIDAKKIELKGAMSATQNDQTRDRINNLKEEIRKLYQEALLDPEISVVYNYQDYQAFGIGPGDMTRTQVKMFEDDLPDELEGSVETLGDFQKVVLKEEDPKMFLTTDPVKNYWAVPQNYAGTEYLFPEDGNLRGDMGTSLVSKALCCDCSIVIFGVEADVPSCKKFKSKEPKEIRVSGSGIPSQVDGVPGQYRFSVIAKPSPDAVVTITPDTFTPANSAIIEVDTEGIYTVKVEYELGGRSSAMTYDIADTKVLFSKASELTWSVKRAGRYEEEIKDHLVQPYYQQRLVKDAVRAAEMLIEPTQESVEHGGNAAGSLGGSTVSIATPGSTTPSTPDPDLVIGQKFKGVFRIPREVEFMTGIFLRAYFKPYDPDLGPDDYEDFALSIDPDTPYEVHARIEADKNMHAIHLMNIQYKEVQRFKGSAVPISFDYQLQDEICPETEQKVAADPDFMPNIYIAETSERTTVFNEYGGSGPTLVNLILYNRDLGECRATNATKDISNAGEIHNVVNGNLFMNIDFFTGAGKGENLQLEISYNSWQAIFQDSLEYYRKLNGLTADFIHKHWDHNFVGKGWKLNYDLQVRHYIKPQDVDGKDLKHYCEFICPDGNRIQFKGLEVDATGIGDYETEYDTDAYLNAVAIGVGLTLTRKTDGVDITTLHARKLTFDEHGDLKEITTPAMKNTSIKPLTVDRSASQVVIEDSSGRKVTIDTIPQANLSFSGQLKVQTPHGMDIEFSLTQSILTKIDFGGGKQVWGPEYHNNFGQGDTCSIMKKLKDPNKYETEFEYYREFEFEGVPKTVAENFWGRLGKAAKGSTDRRTLTWFYEGVDRETQKVIFRNPRDIDFVITYDVVRQALKEMQYSRKHRDPQTKVLQNSPAYIPANQNTNNLDLKPLQKYSYFEKTKHPLEMRNMYDELTTHEYVAVANSKAHQLKKRTKPDGTFVAMEYDATTNFPEKVSTPTKDLSATGYYQFRYNDNFEVKEKVWPPNAALVDRNGNPSTSTLTETWEFDTGTGLMKTYTDLMGTLWTFKYGEGGRDPQNLGLYTSKNMRLAGNAFDHVWEYGYNTMGEVIYQQEPQFGEAQYIQFYPFGERKQVMFQSIPTYQGIDENFFLQYGYDDMFHKTSEATPAVAHVYAFNEHGEVKDYTDPLTTTFETAYEKDGTVKESQNAQGSKTKFFSDELGRTIKKVFVSPDLPNEVKPSEPFAILIEWDDTNKKTISRRFKADASGEPTADLVVENIDTFSGGQVMEQVTKLGGGGKERKVEFVYDQWGQVSETKWYDGATHKKTFKVIRDTWSQVICEEQKDETSTATRISEYQYRPDGNAVVHKQGNGGNVVAYRHDELGRIVEVLDKNNDTLQKLVITDFAKTKSNASLDLYSIDPSLLNGTTLIKSSSTEYNRRGQPVKKVDSLGNVTEKRYDAQGRLRQEVDGNGNITHYTYDRADRVTRVEREITKIGNVSLYGLDKNDTGTLQRVRKLIKEITYAFNDELASVKKENGKTIFYEYDLHGRLKRVKSNDKVEQTILYDALDRIKEKTLPGSNRQIFTYLHQENKVQAEFQNDECLLKLDYFHDWQGMLQQYVVKRFITTRGYFANHMPDKVGMKYVYNGLGDLTEKIYIKGDNEDELARISFIHHESGVIKNQITRIKSGVGELSFNQEFVYDENLRIKEAIRVTNSTSRNGRKKFSFTYNKTGLLKNLSAPFYHAGTQQYVENYSSISYFHDQFGRLTRMLDGRMPYNGIIELHYDYQQRSYIAGALRNDDFAKRNLADAGSLKGLTYTRNFMRGGRREVYTFFQDYMYDGEGNPHSWVSHVDYRVPGYISGNPGQEVWRTFEEDGVNNFSYKRYVKRDYLDRLSHFNYRVKTSVNMYGSINDIEGQRNMPNAFDSFFGRAQAVSQQGRKAGFRDLKLTNGDLKLPLTSRLIYEAPDNTGATAIPYDFDIHKEFFHDSGGRLMTNRQRLCPRTPGTSTFSFADSGGETSLANESHHAYGPDGEELFRLMVEKEEVTNAEQKLFIKNGDTLVAEVDLKRNTYLFHETIPGVGVRLSSVYGDLSNNAIAHEFYYSWDPNGSVMLVKDERDEIVCDFGIPSPDGEIAQFGFGNDSISEISRALQGINLSKEDLYHRISGGLDYLLSQSAACQNRNDGVMAMVGEATVVNAAGNDYGVNIGGYGFRQQVFSVPQQVVQGVIDGIRGFGDALTSGYASKLRAYAYNNDHDYYAVKNVYAYGGGMVLGIAASVYFGAVTATVKLAQASWALRSAWVLTLSNDILGFADAVNNIRSGKATAFDLLGLAAPVSVFQSMKSGFSRSSEIVAHIHLARNAAKIPTVQVRHIGNGTNEIQLVINRTPSMAADLKGQSVINMMHEWVMSIDANPGRKMAVGEALEGAATITVSKEARQFLEGIGIKVRRTQLKNAGEADGLMRKLYSYFHGKEPNTQVGHVLDLRINRGQTRLELQTIEGIIESMAMGLYKKGDKENFVAKMLGTIFEKQHSGTNMAVGGGPTKSIASLIENGIIPENAKIVGVVLGQGWKA